MREIKISELEKVNDFIEESDNFIYLSDVLEAIGEISYEKQRDVTADEIIDFLNQ